jgi:hypothetical protein
MPDIMKIFRKSTMCFIVMFGTYVLPGCATTSQDTASASHAPAADGMKGIEQKLSTGNAGWADSLGWFFLESLYETAVANQSN